MVIHKNMKVSKIFCWSAVCVQLICVAIFLKYHTFSPKPSFIIFQQIYFGVIALFWLLTDIAVISNVYSDRKLSSANIYLLINVVGSYLYFMSLRPYISYKYLTYILFILSLILVFGAYIIFIYDRVSKSINITKVST